MRQLSERRQKWLEYKKQDPIGMKVRFVRDFVFRKFRSHANSVLNNCGWQFEENSDMHKMWKLYHCDLEELERLYASKCNKCYMSHRPEYPPISETKVLFAWYLPRAYKLWQDSQKFYYGMSTEEKEYYESWFRKNLKKYKDLN